ncbi:MAG: FAD-binding protein, partial [Clostridia bacterium]|nr:FAD-binding protein [Clostridia bacterium]
MGGDKTAAVRELEEIVGKKNVIISKTNLMTYNYAAIGSGVSPAIVIFPESTEEVSKVLKVLYKYKIPVIPRGAGTNLNGGTVPLDDVAILELAKMNKVIEVDLSNRFVAVEAGVTNLEVQKALEPHGYFYAPDPASQSVSSIAGNIAENAGGPRCVKYGVTANNVIGLEVVLSDGTVFVSNGPLSEEPGYNLTGIMHASEGMFGVITKAWLRILKKPEAVKTMLAIFNELEDAAKTVSQIIARGIIPTTLELIDNPVLRAVEESEKIGYPLDAAAVLLIEIDGYEDSMDVQVEKIVQVCRDNNVRETRVAKTEKEREMLWWGRRSAGSCMGRLKPAYAEEDVTIPRTKLPEMLKTIGNIAKKYDLIIGNVFHAGDGNFHPEIVYDDRDRDESERVILANAEIMKEAAKLGGTITGEHGVGIEKLKGMPLIFSNDDMEFMWKLKLALDSEKQFNPGKVIPDNISQREATEKLNTREKATQKEEFIQAIKSNGKEIERCFDDKILNEYIINGHIPWCVIWPENAEQTAEVVRLARQFHIKLVPWGRGSKKHALSKVKHVDVIIDLSKINQIIEIDKDNFTAIVAAGANLTVLQEQLHKKGLMLPVDPFEGEPTIGGIVAANSTGSLRLQYKTLKDLVLGVEFVSSEGKIIHYGGKILKNVAGFDLNKLMVGSWGTLGILTKITLKLYPLPEEAVYRCYATGNYSNFKELFIAIQNANLDPVSLDVIVCKGKFYIYICIGGPKEAVIRQMKELDKIVCAGIEIIQEVKDRTLQFGQVLVNKFLRPGGLYTSNRMVMKSSVLIADIP